MMSLDPDLLRTLVAIAETRRFGLAAERVGRSQSAVSLQVRRLEDATGRKLFRRQGRLMELTDAGEVLLGYARRLLALGAEAMTALAEDSLHGPVRFGMVQDFADAVLPGVLGRFARTHPAVRLDVRVSGGQALRRQLEAGELDVALVSGDVSGAHVRARHRAPLVWLGLDGMTFDKTAPVPLALFEGPCPFRDAALDSLNKAGQPFDIVYTSASLTGIQAAVRAGLGVGVRTALALEEGLAALGPKQGLPAMDAATFSLLIGDGASAAASVLADAVEGELLTA